MPEESRRSLKLPPGWRTRRCSKAEHGSVATRALNRAGSSLKNTGHRKDYAQTAKILRTIAHPVRLQILEVLQDETACVCELMIKTGRRQACISQHFMFLRDSGPGKRTRMGQNMRYELAAESSRDFIKCLLQTHRASCQAPLEKKEVVVTATPPVVTEKVAEACAQLKTDILQQWLYSRDHDHGRYGYNINIQRCCLHSW
ncbi:MAG: ArsR/SmtB family transcription factor [Syntrophothermus sp.]